MSLQVWLPLTKDLRNQGLSNVTVTNDGATFNSTGKLGGCYSFSGNAIYGELSNTNEMTSMSGCCWVYLTNLSSAQYFFHLGGISSYPSKIALDYEGSIRSQVNGVEYNSGITLAINTWYHIAVTVGGNKVKWYLNGEEKASTSISGTFNASNHLAIGARINSSTGNTFAYPITNGGRLNDVRIYDHCLSPMEVKELAKGLVLHYPLNDKYIESTTNLITTEDCLSATCYNGATNKYSYGTTTDMYKTVTTFDGRKGTKVYMGTNGNSCFPYVYVNDMFTSDGTNQPTYKTLSFDYYTTISTSICPYKLGSGTGTATYVVSNKNGVQTGTGTNSVTIPVISNAWNHIEITFHGTTSANSEWGYIQNQPTHTSNTSNFWFFANMQLETKDHATGYVGVGGTRTSTIAYDCSGFCNNGIITGALTCSSDTPKYNISTVFNGSSCIDTNINYLGNEWSYGGWIYSATSSRSWEGVLMLNGTNPADADLQFGFYTCPKSNIIQNSANGKYNSSISWTYGVWHHFIGTYDGATLKTYIDGVLVNSTGITQAFLERHNFVIGARHSSGTNHDCYFLGNISDVRIYATALSAVDVKSLYQNSAYIDNSGNVYGAVHTEV